MDNNTGGVISNTEYSGEMYKGFFKVWESNPETGESTLLLDKQNTILFQGADLLALALAGGANSSITHMYLQYCSIGETPSVDAPVKTDTYTDLAPTATTGYLRVPLSFPAVYTPSAGDYTGNTVLFTVVLNGVVTNVTCNGGLGAVPGKFYSAALVASGNPGETAASHPNDKLFARITFGATPLTYSSANSLTITWGVRFTA